jgi:DNA-binding MarR family transcriptional regulator
VNAIFFGLKRAFHGTLRVTRSLLVRLGLTAARFDLMFALPSGRDAESGMLQSKLRRQLGVSRPTVSRMLASLEALGFVRRERDERDRRQLRVSLTKRGRAVIHRAKGIFIRTGLIQLVLDTALGSDITGNRWYDEAHCMVAREALDAMLGRVRHEYGDFAKLRYPSWHPEDMGSWHPDE